MIPTPPIENHAYRVPDFHKGEIECEKKVIKVD